MPMIIIAAVAVIVLVVLIVKKYKKINHPAPAPKGRTMPSSTATGHVSAPKPPAGDFSSPSQLLIKSRFYKEYETTFNFIYRDATQQEYKIDWLLYSLNQGRKLENGGYYVRESMKKGLPYFCETEQKFDHFLKTDKPIMRGSVSGMMDICFFYNDVNKATSHPMKRKYWQDTVVSLADGGNREAQGALCSSYAATVFSQAQSEGFKAKYQDGLLEAANAGDHMAELAVGEFLAPYRSQERLQWLTRAASGNLTDACYQLTEAYQSFITLDDNMSPRTVELSPSQRKRYEDAIAGAWYTGAKANNGVMAGLCQWRVAEYYVDGRSVFGRDINAAKYWYQMAYKNGYEQAKACLEHLSSQV